MTAALTNLRARLSRCRGVLVDNNVLLDIATNDPDWSDWSGRALSDCAEYATLILNPIIYAGVSIGFTTIEALEAALTATLFRREPLRPPVRGLGFGALQQSRIQAQGGFLHALPC